MLKDTKPGIPSIDTGANPTEVNGGPALKGISTIHPQYSSITANLAK